MKKKYRCPSCGKAVYGFDAWKMHRRTQHPDAALGGEYD